MGEYDERPEIIAVIAAEGEVSDEIDYAVNRFISAERGMGLTACQPSLVEIKDGSQAIRFKLDSTYIDAKTNDMMGLGQLGQEEGFVGEVFISYIEDDPEDIHMLFLTPEDEIDEITESVMANPKDYPPNPRPSGKY